jgi:hypothetical protein
MVCVHHLGRKWLRGGCGGKIITIGRGESWCEIIIKKKKKRRENQTVEHGKR